MKKFIKQNIFGILILFSASLMFAYIIYKSELYFGGSKRDHYFKYYILSVILICFGLLMFFFNQILKKYLLILLISSTFSLYLFELYLIKFQRLDTDAKIFKKEFEKNWDTRNRIEFYKDLKKINKDAVVVVNPSNYLLSDKPIFPFSGASNLKTMFCNENGYYAIYESDRYGFNNPDYEWDKKNIEYLLVGDSFTQGACVNRPNDIASVLRNLSEKSSLNLGYGGNGPLISYAVLREYLASNVKKILWIYYEDNDLIDLRNEKNNKILLKYLNDLSFKQNLKYKQNQINELTKESIESSLKVSVNTKEGRQNFNFKFKRFLKLYYTRSALFSTAPQIEFKKILQMTKDLANKNNSKLYFVYLPAHSRYVSIYNNNYRKVKKIVNDLKIPFIDIHEEVFKKEKNPLKLFPLRLSGHYTVEGYKKVSEAIYMLTN